MTQRTVKWLSSTECNFCHKDSTKCGKTFFDAATIHGPWALMCAKCYRIYGRGPLGQGRGQEYDSNSKLKVRG